MNERIGDEGPQTGPPPARQQLTEQQRVVVTRGDEGKQIEEVLILRGREQEQAPHVHNDEHRHEKCHDWGNIEETFSFHGHNFI